MYNALVSKSMHDKFKYEHTFSGTHVESDDEEKDTAYRVELIAK